MTGPSWLRVIPLSAVDAAPAKLQNARTSHRRGLAWIALAALVLVPPTAVAAQAGATLSGRVVDAADDAPVGYASLVLEVAGDGDAVAGNLAGEDGRFTLEGLDPGSYRLWISFTGYQRRAVEVLVGELNSSYDIGVVRLARGADFEETIDVTAEAIRAEGLDSRVFRLDEGASQSTGSLLDAMKGLPGVTVDQDGKVSLRGSDQVAVLIDGRQSSLTGFGSQRGLDSVSATNVERIEIINNPSARFDAAGMAGIINIIYKEEQKLGVSGDVGLTVGNGQFSRQRSDLPTELGSYSNNEKIIPSFNLNYNTEKVRSFVQTEVLFQDDLPNNEFTTRFYDDGRIVESQVPENREQTHYLLKTGLDWQVGPRRTFSASAIYDFETHTDRAQVPFILQSSGERERFWFWREEEDTGFANLSLDYLHAFATPGHQLHFNLQYTRGWEDESYFLNEESDVRVGTDMTRLDAEENTLPLSVDYTRPLRSGRLELGTKLQSRWIPIQYTVMRGEGSVIYEGLGDTSDWDEDLIAVYGNLVWEKQRYSLEAGLRVESTEVAYTIPAENIYYDGSDAYDDLELFPNIKFTFKRNAANRFLAAYNRRVDRPGEPELRIFPKYDDPELLKVGNPFLRPQFTDVLELGYRRSWPDGSLETSLYRRDIQDAFFRVFAIDDTNPNYDIVNKIFENAGNSTQLGAEILFSQQLTPSWNLTGSLNYFETDIEAFSTTLLFPTRRSFNLAASKDDTWDLKLTQEVSLPGAVELQLNYIRYAERNVPQGRERARSSLDLAVKRPLRGDRADLVFTFTDMLNDFAVVREIDGEGFTALYENYLETQVASLSLRYRF